MTVEWTEAATAQVIAVRDYLLRSSSGYAQIVADRIVRATEILERLPYAGAEVPEYADEAIREVFEHPYRILYRIANDHIQVVAVIHSARRLPRTPPG